MITRFAASATTLALALTVMAQAALAQKAPPPGQGPPQMSLERAWAWLMARPGVMVALGVIAVAIVYMIISKRKSKG